MNSQSEDPRNDHSQNEMLEKILSAERQIIGARRKKAKERFGWISIVDDKNHKTRDEIPEDSSPLVGLALSGGGIRSATFNLGLLQAMHEKGVMPFIDYLSTVSGGGFIGASLSTKLNTPQKYDLGNRFPFSKSEVIQHLMKHGNYLIPRPGLNLNTLKVIGYYVLHFILNVTFYLLFIHCIMLLFGLDIFAYFFPLLHSYPWYLILQKPIILICVMVAYGYLINPNKTSLHQFYCNHLRAAYIDEPDKSRICTTFLNDLQSDEHGTPYHLINCTINLAGTDNQRMADSFVLSPLFCGSRKTGYETTKKVPESFCVRSIRIQTAMAISGAAVSPQMGTRTSEILAFLMTVFNFRLGFWIHNPKPMSFWKRFLLSFWPIYPLLELCSKENEKYAYCLLSDGGHFENLGVYELIRRKCQYIIISDASEDAGLKFDDLGKLTQKTRIDFDCKIDLNVNPLRAHQGSFSHDHFVFGGITYKDGQRGKIIYIKPTLTGDEPIDLDNYKRNHLSFPHESTSDQFFDESQFESYRELGHHIGTEVFKKFNPTKPNFDSVKEMLPKLNG